MKRAARVAFVFLMLIGVLFLFGFPARTYFEQSTALASTTDRLHVLDKSNKDLSARAKELHSDAAIERLAREQYNLVRPGEEAFAILPGPTVPTPVAHTTAKTGQHPGFWSRLWDKLTFWS